MRIYISGAFTEQARLRPHAEALRALGHDVVSSWLYEPAKPNHLGKKAWYHALATKDVAEVFASDCIIMDLDGESTTGGRFTEWGVACHPGSMRLRFLVGGAGKEGVFLMLAHAQFAEWSDLLEYLGSNP